MLDIIKKSYETTLNNPIILIFWIAYLFIMPICYQILLNSQGVFLFSLTLIMIILFNSAFFAGWFAIIKSAVENSKKIYLNSDEKYADMLKLNNVFFSAIPSYILPILGIFIIYVTGYIIWLSFTVMLAKNFIGNIDFLLENIKSISGTTAETLSYLQSLSVDQLRIIYGWQLFLLGAIAIFGILTQFVPPALYFEKNKNKNPFRALVNSAKTIVKRPLGVIGFSLVIQILFFTMMLAQRLCMFNVLLYFVYLVVSVYVTVFMFLLLFNYYDKRFTDNCYNRTNCVRENEDIDNSCKED